jgi:hypothetical protein
MPHGPIALLVFTKFPFMRVLFIRSRVYFTYPGLLWPLFWDPLAVTGSPKAESRTAIETAIIKIN